MTEPHSANPAEIRNAAFRLAAERGGWAGLSLSDIAGAAGVGLAEFQQAFPSKAAILEAFARDMDHAVLELVRRDPVTGEAHDRVFDVLLRRLEIMAPYRTALAAIYANPGLSPSELARLAMRAQESMGWMLAAAGLESPGLSGAVNRQGLALVYARVLQVWLGDEDAGLARTMAALDRALRDAALWRGRLSTPIKLAESLCRGLFSLRRSA